MTDTLTRELRVLTPGDWTRLRDRHAADADRLTAAHRERRSRGERHPVWDFMFHYYPVKPSQLRRWNPGAGAGLLLNGMPEAAARDTALPGPSKFHHRVMTGAGEVWTVDTDAFFTARADSVTFIHRLLRATAGRSPRFSCFGMHEWAMVYHGSPRHPEPLRLGREATDRLVEERPVNCTHFDAFRFFTPDAVPMNSCILTRESQVDSEQPGCLHATMDLYKWATKLGPLVPGDLWLDTFRLACEIRATDMEAGPYDLSAWGHDPVPVETAGGRAEFARRQRSFADRGQRLRRRLTELLETTYPQLCDTPVPESRRLSDATVENPATAGGPGEGGRSR